MFALTLGFESLLRSQVERKRMATHQFRFYHRRPVYIMLLRSVLFAIAASCMSWNFYSRSPKLGMYAYPLLLISILIQISIQTISAILNCLKDVLYVPLNRPDYPKRLSVSFGFYSSILNQQSSVLKRVPVC